MVVNKNNEFQKTLSNHDKPKIAKDKYCYFKKNFLINFICF